VTVEYDPRHVEANRLKGTRSSSGGPFVVFGLVLPGLGGLITAAGLWSGWKASRLMRRGLPSAGYVQTCRLPARRSRGSAHAGGTTVTWSSSASQPEMPVAEFREQIWAQQRAALATARKVRENPVARGCGWTLAFLFAVAFGGGVTAALLATAAAIVLPALDVPAETVLHAALGLGCAGLLLGTFLVMRWIIRKERQRQAAESPDARPPAFDQVECTLSFWLADGESTGQTQRTLRLTGDEEDEQPRPLLYDPTRPARTLLVSEIGLPLQIDDEGQWLYAGAWPVLRLALMVLALGVPVVAWFLV
jgi:hypothetical protein